MRLREFVFQNQDRIRASVTAKRNAGRVVPLRVDPLTLSELCDWVSNDYELYRWFLAESRISRQCLEGGQS